MTEITHLKATDRDQWQKLFCAYIAFYEAQVPDPVIEATFNRLVAGANSMVGLIARNEAGRAIGLAHLVFHRSTWSETWYCYLEDLFVEPDVRGSGVGRCLFDAVYREADARGATRTYWATKTDNATARRLYDRVGVLTPFVQYRR